VLLQKLRDPSPMLVIDPMVSTEETKSDWYISNTPYPNLWKCQAKVAVHARMVLVHTGGIEQNQ
jgi:hypothetical protein